MSFIFHLFLGPIRTAVMTKTGHGKYLTEAKCPNGVDENWTMTFTSGKLVLVRVSSLNVHI